MIKLFQAQNKENTYWCFAPDTLTAKKILSKESGIKNISIEDITNEHSKDDGFQYLVDHKFVGIPSRDIFFLNGCMSAIQEHYEDRHRSGVLWWSEKVPGSRELWNTQVVNYP